MRFGVEVGIPSGPTELKPSVGTMSARALHSTRIGIVGRGAQLMAFITSVVLDVA